MKQRIVFFLLLILVFPAFLAAVTLSEKQFQQDMNYYLRSAKKEKFSANDRLYVLNRLRKKYRDVEFDTSALYAEINYWYGAKLKQEESGEALVSEPLQPEPESELGSEPEVVPAPSTPKASFPPNRETLQAVATLEKVSVSKRGTTTEIELNAPGLKKFQDILIKDDYGNAAPVLVLYLYDTAEKLQQKQWDFSQQGTAVKKVFAKQVEFDPPTTKLTFSLAEDLAYNLEQSGDQLLIQFAPPRGPRPVDEDYLKKKSLTGTELSINKPGPTLPINPDLPAAVPASPWAAVDVASPVVTATTPSLDELLGKENLKQFSDFIKPGDSIEFDVRGPLTFNQKYYVPPDGKVQIPLVGEVGLVGYAQAELETKVANTVRAFYPEATVRVQKLNIDLKSVYLNGQLRKPGSYRWEDPAYCTRYIQKAGGFSASARRDQIHIYRQTDQKVLEAVLNYDALVRQRQFAGDFSLQGGDWIEVPQEKNTVLILGAVKHTGWHSLENGNGFLQLVHSAGGFSRRADIKGVRLFREKNGTYDSVVVPAQNWMNSKQAESIILQPQDILVVPLSPRVDFSSSRWRKLSWAAFLVSLVGVLALSI